MFVANYKTTLKTMLRSPATLLAMFAAVLMIATTTFEQHGPNFVADNARLVRQDIWNQVRCSVWNFLPAFIGVIAASNILEEKANQFDGIVISSQKTLASFYTSKLIAIMTLGGIMQIVFLCVWCVNYWFFQEKSVTLELWDVLQHYLVNELIYLPLGILVATSFTVFWGTLTGVPSVGSIFSVGYYFLQYVFRGLKSGDNILSNYLYFIPRKLDKFMSLYNEHENIGLNLVKYNSSLPGHALLSIVFHVFFSVLLLFVSYGLYMRSYKKGRRKN